MTHPPLQPYNSTTLVFFGSGPVATASLALLIADGFQIEAVITKAKPAHHRGDFPVLKLSEEAGLKTFTPNGKAELSELFHNSTFDSRLGIVIDYGFIINQDVIDSFPLGIVNSHFSLLPEWRGADPISFAILSGQQRTGVSLMLITAGMDEGPLLAQTPFDIPEGCSTPQLTDALIEISNDALVKILPKYIKGDIIPAPQAEVTIAISAEPTYSRKLSKQDGIIDWSKPAEQIEREIRAFIEWPKSRTTLAGKDVVITKATVLPSNGSAGIPYVINKELLIPCGEGTLRIERLKPAGKAEMDISAFLAGYGHLIQPS